MALHNEKCATDNRTIHQDVRYLFFPLRFCHRNFSSVENTNAVSVLGRHVEGNVLVRINSIYFTIKQLEKQFFWATNAFY